MKSMILGLILASSSAAFAQTATLYYTEGSLRGQAVTNRTHIGKFAMCFQGSAKSITYPIYQVLSQDPERIKAFARLDESKNQIVLGYVSTKCLDEGESEYECREVQTIPACR